MSAENVDVIISNCRLQNRLFKAAVRTEFYTEKHPSLHKCVEGAKELTYSRATVNKLTDSRFIPEMNFSSVASWI